MSHHRSVVELLRSQLQAAQQVLEGTVGDVSAELAGHKFEGAGNPIGAQYMHALVALDVIANALARGQKPLLADGFAGRTGMSLHYDHANWHQWAHDVTIDMGQARQYAQAVYAANDAWLAEVEDAELERPVDLSALSLGTMSLAQTLSLMVSHTAWHTGEISALKGLHGQRGYPF